MSRKDPLSPNLDPETALGLRVVSVIIFGALTIAEAVLYGNIDHSPRMLGVMVILGIGFGPLSICALIISFGISHQVKCVWRKRRDRDNWPRIIEYLADRAIAGDAVAIELLPLIRQGLKLPSEKVSQLDSVLEGSGIVMPQLVLSGQISE